jgi:hypothetical protein
VSAVGSISFTVTAGAAGTVTVVGPASSGGSIQDGNYQININQDNSGTMVSVSTPVGDAQASDLRPTWAADS